MKRFNDIEKEDKYIKKLIKKADSFTEIKESFQKKYLYCDLCGIKYHYYRNGEGLFIPNLEKAFESLGYTKKE